MTKEKQTQHDREVAEIRQLQAETARLNAEAAKRAAEADKRAAEADKRAAEADKQLAELRQSNAELRQFIADLAKRSEETDKRIAALGVRADKALAVAEKNNKYIGDHSRNEGELLEMECYNTLVKTKEINGVKLDGFQLGNKNPEHGVEIDIIGFNGKVTMPIEVKRTLSADDVRRFVDVRLDRFPKAFPQYANDKAIKPVIIFAMPRTGEDEDPVKLALKLGLTVLQSIGENQLSPITTPDQVISRSDKDD